MCRQIGATRDYHTKWSKSEREGQISQDITYMWYLKYDTNEPIYRTEIDSQTQRTDWCLPRGRGLGRGGVSGSVSRCKLLYIQWIRNKALLHSTWSYIQYPVINHNGKESKKRTSICVSLSHFAIQQRLAQHRKTTLLQKKNFFFNTFSKSRIESPKKLSVMSLKTENYFEESWNQLGRIWVYEIGVLCGILKDYFNAESCICAGEGQDRWG